MNKASLILLCALLAGSALAQERKSTTDDVESSTSKVDEADAKITNRRFRASNGSLSDFSMNLNLSYNGGSLAKPFAADRPNISNAGDTTSIAGISGTVNGTYRLNKLNRINIGTGVQMLAPFNDDIDTDSARAQKEFDDNRGELDVTNPYFSYVHLNNFFGVQTIGSVGITQYTASNLTDIGYQNSLDLSLNTMYAFGKTGFSIGALVVYSKYAFDKNDEEFKENQNDVVWGFLPQAEYVINDTFNLRTIVRSNWYDNNKADSDFRQRIVTQSVGLGISVSRDVFLYPNIQFVPQDLKSEITNVGFTANINMF